ncbi:MAG TPA: hypothetical protein VEY07_07560 [Thermoplasmata archaeon]|nr:hypothetical protein [Thermoplasmata archaeon]
MSGVEGQVVAYPIGSSYGEIGYELRAELGLRFAQRGWDAEAELIDLPAGRHIVCRRTGPLNASSAESRRSFLIDGSPAREQATRIVAALAAEGWSPDLAVARGNPHSIGSTFCWCVPE